MGVTVLVCINLMIPLMGNGAMRFNKRTLIKRVVIPNIPKSWKENFTVAEDTRESKLTPEQVSRILEANFHTALDARYATSKGYLYAAFIHPLSLLTEREIRSAVVQVANLARAFGTTYSSGGLVYGGGSPPI